MSREIDDFNCRPNFQCSDKSSTSSATIKHFATHLGSLLFHTLPRNRFQHTEHKIGAACFQVQVLALDRGRALRKGTHTRQGQERGKSGPGYSNRPCHCKKNSSREVESICHSPAQPSRQPPFSSTTTKSSLLKRARTIRFQTVRRRGCAYIEAMPCKDVSDPHRRIMTKESASN